jgi:hypothetical protein
MTVLSSFEVLAQPLIPAGVMTPPGTELPPVPFVLQAFFVQVSLPTEAAGITVSFDLNFEETTNFQHRKGGVLAQCIDETGSVDTIKTFLSDASIGFNNQMISSGQTKIYSVTALPAPSNSAAESGIPQSGIGWRGLVTLTANPSQTLIVTPTQRQIYFTASDLKTVTDAVVYPVPTASGSLTI